MIVQILLYTSLIDNITHFHPSFFLIAKEDARLRDPQALLVLEESSKLFYHAGYLMEELKGFSVGVYLGGRSQILPEEKLLEQAKKDGDRIYAVIKGLAINNDGRKAGPAPPNIEAQKTL